MSMESFDYYFTGVLMIIVCIFGIIGNTITLFILNLSRDMRKQPINIYLTVLAIFDNGVLFNAIFMLAIPALYVYALAVEHHDDLIDNLVDIDYLDNISLYLNNYDINRNNNNSYNDHNNSFLLLNATNVQNGHQQQERQHPHHNQQYDSLHDQQEKYFNYLQEKGEHILYLFSLAPLSSPSSSFTSSSLLSLTSSSLSSLSKHMSTSSALLTLLPLTPPTTAASTTTSSSSLSSSSLSSSSSSSSSLSSSSSSSSSSSVVTSTLSSSSSSSLLSLFSSSLTQSLKDKKLSDHHNEYSFYNINHNNNDNNYNNNSIISSINEPIVIDPPPFASYLDIIFPLAHISLTGSIWTTCLITVERYFVVCHPFRAMALSNRVRAIHALIILSLAAILYNFPRFMEVEVIKENNQPRVTKSNLRSNRLYYWIYYIGLHLLLLYVIPLTLLSVLNTKIYHAVRKATKNRTNLTRHEQSELNIASMLVLLVTIFICCNAPAFLANVMELIGDPKLVIISRLSNFLVCINSSTNFVIYCTFSKKFRQKFKSVFICNSKMNEKKNSSKNIFTASAAVETFV